MISVEEALERILSQISSLSVTRVPLPQALGLVLAEDVIAQEDIPPFANSAMDGYALLSQDSQPHDGQPPRLHVTGEVAAGYVAEHAVEEGTAMRIMTGAPVPPGADSVIQVELTRTVGPNSEEVEILEAVTPGNNIRPAGEDMHRGQTILTHGTVIGPWEIGVLAGLGARRPPSRQRREHDRRQRADLRGIAADLVDELPHVLERLARRQPEPLVGGPMAHTDPEAEASARQLVDDRRDHRRSHDRSRPHRRPEQREQGSRHAHDHQRHQRGSGIRARRHRADPPAGFDQ